MRTLAPAPKKANAMDAQKHKEDSECPYRSYYSEPKCHTVSDQLKVLVMVFCAGFMAGFCFAIMIDILFAI